MPDGLKRYYGRGHLHFLTFSCYDRLPFLESESSRNLLVNELVRVRTEYGFRLIGYVVMPEHVHLLVSEPKKGTVSTVMQMLKQRVSRKMRKHSGTSFFRDLRPALINRGRGTHLQEAAHPICEDGRLVSAFWMERFYDFNVHNQKKITEKLDYMHANPVKRGLAEHPGDWMWSSWGRIVKGEKGLIEIDSWR